MDDETLIYAGKKIVPWRRKVAALEADNAKLREALKTALEANGYSQQGIATLIGRLSDKGEE